MLATLSGCVSSGVRRDTCPSFRVMTWNIAAGHGNLGGIAEGIRSLDPDVVALQEVDVRWSERSQFVDQADSLAKLLHMNVRFGPIYDLKPRQFGVAILSRFPVVSSRNHEITRLSTQQQNPAPAKAPGFLETVLDVRGTQVRVFSTHLDYRADPSVRQQQVGDMMQVIRESAMPTILAGDLNAIPSAAELQPLLTMFQTAATGMTYPAEAPAKRIDYILASRFFTMSDARIDSTAASDHRPVIMTLMPCRVMLDK